MYDLKFESNTTGKVLFLNYENDIIVSRVEGATGTSVSLGLSQGYKQVGQSVIASTVGGMTLTIRGKILDANTQKKQDLLKTFAPFSTGRLWWDNKYFVDVEVKDSPTITQERHSVFSFRLFSQSPFWSNGTLSSFTSGISTAQFSFPIKYSSPHNFGSKDFSKEYNVYNSGSVDTVFELKIWGTEPVKNPKITNKKTGEFLRFIGDIETGELLTMRQTAKAIYITKTAVDGTETNEFSMLDDESSLFRLKIGDNVLTNEAEEGIYSMVSKISFYPLESGVLANGV